MTTTTIPEDQLYWYKDAIIYEVHVKAFKDTNRDGVGDLGGLLQQLDYLSSLGVTAIWLLPFYPSPLKDDGYDISDYYSINPAYGDLKQFRKLLKAAHAKGMKVITELVVNHTSDQHEWFQRARRAPKGSAERNYYVWTDDPNQYDGTRIIFQDFEASNWTWDPLAGQYYWHRFFHHQPDLNFDNPRVQKEVFKVLDFWCKMGVDGFRLDAVPYLFEREGTNCENLPETHDFLKKLRAYVDKHYPGTLLLAEANMWPEDSASYFGSGDECHMNYHFPIMPRMFMALQMEDRYPITDIYEQTPDIPTQCQWALFLRNHDELTLEMVTDEERDYMYRMYVKDPKARINLGIRHRLAPLMENDRRRIELMNYLLFSLPGTPVIYYGDEIGMGDNYYLGDRDGVRTPMQWSPDRNAGFSDANPQQLYLPLVTDPLYNYEYLNVELQQRNPSSLLWFMKRLIATRKKYKCFSRGNMRFIPSDNAKVLSFIRSYGEEHMLVVVNLSRYPQPAELNLTDLSKFRLKETNGGNYYPPIPEDKNYFISLSEYQCLWFQLEAGDTAEQQPAEMPVISNSSWERILSGTEDARLTELIRSYLPSMRWFGGKSRRMQSVEIKNKAVMTIGSEQALLLVVTVHYKSGLPEYYQIPLCYVSEAGEASLLQSTPGARVGIIEGQHEKGYLYDALYNAEFRTKLFGCMQQQSEWETGDGDMMRFRSVRALQEANGGTPLVSRFLPAEQSNSSVVYGQQFFMKVYRKVDGTINPDLEMTRFLSEKAGFTKVPRYMGSVEWSDEKGTMVLAMVQEMVDNYTDGWKYMLEALRKYTEKVHTGAYADIRSHSGPGIQPYSPESTAMIKELIGPAVCEHVMTLGLRTAEMHLALTSSDAPAFLPEAFSQHYQRSLFSGFQSGLRASFQLLEQNLSRLPDSLKAEASALLLRKEDLSKKFRNIYKKKYDIVKIRIHGDYHLGQTLFKGPDVLILDFEGEPARSYSERRLKRSALRDVAGMIRSFSYAAYSSVLAEGHDTAEELKKLAPYLEQWQYHITRMFLNAYIEKLQGTQLIPDNMEDLLELLEIYVLEKAVYELAYELNNRPDWAIIPIKSIQSIIG